MNINEKGSSKMKKFNNIKLNKTDIELSKIASALIENANFRLVFRSTNTGTHLELKHNDTIKK